MFPRNPTQVAYQKIQGGLGFKQIWGCDVENAVLTQALRPDEILKWLKVTMFDDTSFKSFHKDRLRLRMRVLKSQGILPEDTKVEDLWVDLLRNTYRHILDHIRLDYSGMDRYLKDSSVLLNHDSISETAGVKIKVVFAAPANASIETVNKLVTTATKAQIPHVEVVAEPFAALVAAAQLELQDRSTLPEGVPMIIADIGAGTIDVVPVELRGEIISSGGSAGDKFWTVHELATGEANWNGMAFVDSAFRSKFKEHYNLSDKMSIIQRGAPTLTEDTILDTLQWRFESKKAEFDGYEESYQEIQLEFPGLPDMMGNMFTVRNGIINLSFEFVKECFDVVVKPLINSLTRFIKKSETNGRPIGQIILTGGGSENEYVKGRVFELEFSQKNRPIYIERHGSMASMRTVFGAALVGLNRTVMGHRRVRRGYCFAYDVPLKSKRNQDTGLYYDPATGQQCVKRVSNFLLSIGNTIGEGFTRYASQNLNVFPECRQNIHGLKFSQNGLIIQESLYYTDDRAACKNLLRVDQELHPRTGRFKKACTLEFELPNRIWQRLPLLLDFAKVPNLYIFYQYDIGITIERGILKFFLLIPKCGRFESREAIKAPDLDKIIRVEVTRICSGIFTDAPNTSRQSTFGQT